MPNPTIILQFAAAWKNVPRVPGFGKNTVKGTLSTICDVFKTMLKDKIRENCFNAI